MAEANNNISLQSICRADLPYLWNVYVASMKQHIEKIWGWDETWQKNDFSKSLNIYQTAILVYKAAKIGCIQYNLNDEDVYINMLILEDDYRNQGIGAEILSIIQSKLARKTTVLKCFKVNQKAYKFYLKNDFVLFDEDENFFKLSRWLG